MGTNLDKLKVVGGLGRILGGSGSISSSGGNLFRLGGLSGRSRHVVGGWCGSGSGVVGSSGDGRWCSSRSGFSLFLGLGVG